MDLIIILNAIRMVNLNTQLTVTNVNLTISIKIMFDFQNGITAKHEGSLLK